MIVWKEILQNVRVLFGSQFGFLWVARVEINIFFFLQIPGCFAVYRIAFTIRMYIKAI